MFETAALAAAMCWALNGLIAVIPSRAVGAVKFNLVRMSLVSIGLTLYVTIFIGWGSIKPDFLSQLILSGFIGVFMGDTVQFLALNRLGPRRTAMLFSLNAPIAAVFGWFFIDEILGIKDIVGILLCISGVFLSIAYGAGATKDSNQWEEIRGPIWIALSLGVAAAVFQSVGSLIIRPVLSNGVDPVASSAIRMGVAAIGLLFLSKVNKRFSTSDGEFTLSLFGWTALSGFLGMGIGMTLVMYALVGAEVGIVSTLASTTPALMLPLLWLKTGNKPLPTAWIGALLVFAGCGFIFL